MFKDKCTLAIQPVAKCVHWILKLSKICVTEYILTVLKSTKDILFDHSNM